MKKKLIKSAEEDQFEVDETIIDEVSNAEEFADVEITEEDIVDAVQAIEALAEAVIEEANVEEKEIDADELLDEIRDMIDETHDEEPAEEEFPEEEELPEELTNSAVRVMVSEDGAIEVEQTPDEVYEDNVDGLECTVFDTCEDVPLDVEDSAVPEDTEDDVLVIGNSASKKYKKGYVVLKSSTNKKAWSAAYKKVKKMIGSSKLKAVHWVIVSALAKKEEEKDKLKKKIECKLIKTIRSNKDRKAKFCSKLLKSSEEFEPNGGATDPENKPTDMNGEGNTDYHEEGNPENAVSPEQIEPEDVTNNSGDTTETLDAEGVDVPDEDIVVVDVPLTNSKKKVQMKKISSRLAKGYNIYQVVNSSKEIETLNGKVIKCGKVAYAFKNTSQGLFACVAQYVDKGKGTYKPVLLKNNKVVITRGTEANVFQSAERVIIAKRIASAHFAGRKEGMKKAKQELLSARRTPARKPVTSARTLVAGRKPVRSGAIRPEVLNNPRRPVTSAAKRTGTPARKPVMSAARREILSERTKARQAIRSANAARQNEMKLRSMHEAEERQRLFQSSQRQMAEEKREIKSNNTRNMETMAEMYRRMF